MTDRRKGSAAGALEGVASAARSRNAAERAYRDAVLGAVAVLERHNSPRPFAEVARAAGVSRQAVRQIVLRASARS